MSDIARAEGDGFPEMNCFAIWKYLVCETQAQTIFNFSLTCKNKLCLMLSWSLPLAKTSSSGDGRVEKDACFSLRPCWPYSEVWMNAWLFGLDEQAKLCPTLCTWLASTDEHGNRPIFPSCHKNYGHSFKPNPVSRRILTSGCSLV